ncbi:UDP-N-acetylmuramoyl-L-alanyl-D-glutamate--2,6-diaminopimelate ligase [Pseudobacteriovorax antillogorgiicola]|uniref:UDP-N-acetylmuramoyl-L-alanyl-D-glutamate--2,6-diaminopimelate ligase n=1 Tax=Pseudobacteriovorax antillogorgiicola TaxID=1513793 RepID=A0A1Y6BTF2_9BACT|nr:UDP-N-acetylmuramoyl-L-alanyl-D-glutamate--2,6-diaminopimelate ligase [Pseudobacteriovorax antillogorgiicola]TCS53912.1 UDP-N-acetylmuramoylalanyl-D-glutamate--2,6-diaminopimelate ligase [Pseudobacteriovorax antillogorgiicola]SMF20644.1 UDP-N-acetylmuramoylalanyl-D-glutamate--2,6-diaminopimelate ligase [Pseudobacteriovorax antillogorgiicola]
MKSPELSELLAYLRQENLIQAEEIVQPQSLGQVVSDSRQLKAGDVFIAYQGVSFDSHETLCDMTANGAGLVILDKPKFLPDVKGFNHILVKNSRKVWAYIAAMVHGHPETRVPMYGVTGTNGKTSSAWLSQSLLKPVGKKVFVIGTMGAFLGDEFFPTRHTTPDPDELFSLLKAAADRGADLIVMEVSSHAIVQEKLGPIRFQGVLFTSFSRDHLDFHETMEEYFDAKLQAFRTYLEAGGAKVAHESVMPLLQAKGEERVISYGSRGDWQMSLQEASLDGCRLQLQYESHQCNLNVPLVGDFIVQNLVGVLILLREHWQSTSLQELLNQLSTVPGRLERVQSQGSDERVVLVDYAHTPDALEKCLASLRPLATKRLVVVFGCGGDRDRGKRPLMAQAAARYGDHLLITSDNPRTEDPQQIIDDIVAGLPADAKARCTVEIDRRQAIATAVGMLNPRDCLLIAGKGHEDYQIIGKDRIDFDDRLVARDAMDNI